MTLTSKFATYYKQTAEFRLIPSVLEFENNQHVGFILEK